MPVFEGGAVLTVVASLAAIAAPVSATATLTAEYLATAGNSSLFTRWRPRSHFLSPHSWMNDACGAVYDAATETYHLHYQFHPNHVDWGNVSWGHAVSKDLFHWTDDPRLSLASGKYAAGPLSQFTGTTQPVNVKGVNDGTLLTFSTGIHALPVNWNQPYSAGGEVQALYTSTDGGHTWEEVGTVISDPPKGWNVTGWRDPNFFPSTELDSLLQVSEPHYYMVLGSGLKTGASSSGYIGPRVPLYTAPASNLTQWAFLGALWEPVANSSLGNPDVTGSYGYTFEVGNFFNLPAGEEKAWFVLVGSDGGETNQHWRSKWALWNRGDVARRDNGSVEFTPNSGTALDWGMSYAQATWTDNHARRIVWGWANEDFLPDYAFNTSKQFGYRGSFNLPMELYVKETTGVHNCGTQQDGNFCIESCNGTVAQTLGIRPLPDVIQLLRKGTKTYDFQVGKLVDANMSVSANMGTSYELTATLSDFRGRAGIIVGQSPDRAEYTTIAFDPSTSQIGVLRSHSSLLKNFNKASFVGHFEPYKIRGEAGDGAAATEDLDFHIVLDGSLLEIWVNERFALTARIYPSRNDSTGLGFFAGDAATWKDVRVWAGLAKAWPERPDDTSVPLVWDSPEQTNNYTWWTGY
ncbi:levanase [Colletotrichum spaethianum]|uniref:Levanase n=1 Tax=Colletotrichum spaethianum TaxID=700344 RepID=A0AA37P735_9PEZI|nr:levanase [Colletotrichum spaethianum]GKT41839.1 levanase [Colletotrichum spaethianum]